MAKIDNATGAWASATVAAGEIWQVHSGAILVDAEPVEASRLGIRLFVNDWIEWTSAKTIYYRLASGTSAIIGTVVR